MSKLIKWSKSFVLILLFVIFYYYIMHSQYTQSASIDKTYIINLDKSALRYEKMQKKLKSIELSVPYDRFSAIDGRQVEFENLETGEILIGQEILDKKIWLKGNFKATCKPNSPNSQHVLITNLNQEYYNPRIPGEIGVTCSRKYIWQDIIDNKYKNALIMEDDIIFIPFFNMILNSAMNNAPKDYELLFLQYKNMNQAFNVESNNIFSSFYLTFYNKYLENFFWKRAKKNIMSARGYILTYEGAKKLLECESNISKKWYKPDDLNVSYCIKDMPIITYASKPKFIFSDERSSSISDINRLEQIK